jgi:hypothetical protein
LFSAVYIFFPLQVLDPRGAKFILLPRYTVATMQPLYAVRAFDYVVLTIGYVCLMSKKINVSCNFFVHNQTIKPHWIPPQLWSGVLCLRQINLLMGFILFQTGTNTEIASFWVRVSLRFQANDRSDAKWKRWFRYVHGVSWLTFLSLAIALIFYDQPLLILIYNLQVIVYTVFSWVLLFVAYRTIYQNTISRLSTSSSTRSLSSSKSKNAKTRERNLKSVQKLTGVALGSIAALTFCLLALLVATALDVTQTPLGYLINVGFVYRFAEILYIGTLCYIMNVKPKSKRKSSGRGGGRGGGGREGTKKKLQSKDKNSGGGGTKKKAATANIGHSSLSATPSTSAPTTLSPQVPSFSSDLSSRDSNSSQWLGAFAMVVVVVVVVVVVHVFY